MRIVAIKTDGTTESSYTVELGDVTISPIDTNVLGDKTVTVTYRGLTATTTVKVENYITAISAQYTGGALHNGDTVNTGLITVTAIYADKTQTVLTEGVTFSNTTVNATGNVHYVTVSYPGVQNTTASVNVLAATISYTYAGATATWTSIWF